MDDPVDNIENIEKIEKQKCDSKKRSFLKRKFQELQKIQREKENGIEKQKCDFCEIFFAKKELKSHISSNHTCNTCMKYFKDTEDLKNHIFNGHKDVQCSIANEKENSEDPLNIERKKTQM